MSDYQPETDENENDDNGYVDPNAVRQQRQRIKQLEDENRDAKEAAEAGLAAQRKLALMEAGIDTNSGPGKLFADSYQGELTPEAVKAKAQEYGILAAEPDPAAQPVSPQLAAQAQLAAVSQGASSATPSVNTELANAQSEEEVLAILRRTGMEISYEDPQSEPMPWAQIPG